MMSGIRGPDREMFVGSVAARRPKVRQRNASTSRIEDDEPQTVIDADLTVSGELLCDSHVRVEGRLEGDINAESLTLCSGAHVEGAIYADTVYIYGSLTGSVSANTVVVASGARIIGTIFHNSLTIEPGAYLEGRRPWRLHIDRKLHSSAPARKLTKGEDHAQTDQ